MNPAFRYICFFMIDSDSPSCQDSKSDECHFGILEGFSLWRHDDVTTAFFEKPHKKAVKQLNYLCKSCLLATVVLIISLKTLGVILMTSSMCWWRHQALNRWYCAILLIFGHFYAITFIFNTYFEVCCIIQGLIA